MEIQRVRSRPVYQNLALNEKLRTARQLYAAATSSNTPVTRNTARIPMCPPIKPPSSGPMNCPANCDESEHRAILAALRERNKALAEKLVQAHIRRSRDRLLIILKESRRSLRARGAVLG
jgi:DNA-binding GntR family transcriptional regulator